MKIIICAKLDIKSYTTYYNISGKLELYGSWNNWSVPIEAFYIACREIFDVHYRYQESHFPAIYAFTILDINPGIYQYKWKFCGKWLHTKREDFDYNIESWCNDLATITCPIVYDSSGNRNQQLCISNKIDYYTYLAATIRRFDDMYSYIKAARSSENLCWTRKFGVCRVLNGKIRKIRQTKHIHNPRKHFRRILKYIMGAKYISEIGQHILRFLTPLGAAL